MGCLCAKIVDKSTIDVLDYTPQDLQYEYLRPRGTDDSGNWSEL